MFYLLASGLSFMAYGADKAWARRGLRRLPERYLHWLALLGGWPGAWLGQRFWRHKRCKLPYMRRFRAIVRLHLLGWLGWLLYGIGLWPR